MPMITKDLEQIEKSVIRAMESMKNASEALEGDYCVENVISAARYLGQAGVLLGILFDEFMNEQEAES